MRKRFNQALDSVRERLTLVAPYITEKEATFVCKRLSERRGSFPVSVDTLTSLRIESVLSGSLELEALNALSDFSDSSRVTTLPRLHAKVFIFDDEQAFVGSANLTTSALDSNYEYGVALSGSELVQQVVQDMHAYVRLGSVVTGEQLSTLSDAVASLSAEQEALRRSASAEAKAVFEEALTSTNAKFAEAFVGERSAQELFSEAILYVLSSGPLETKAMHPKIQQLLPELCDDSETLIINGERYGKAWKHQVRNAQQSLKRRDLVEYESGKWYLK